MPGDLNLKKSWHPGLKKNQSKIWNKEQETLQEFQKIEKREQEIKQEKERLELLKIQYPDGIPSSKLNQMNWMYDNGGGSSDKSKEVDEGFLLGRKKVEQLLMGKGIAVEKKKSRLEMTLESGNASEKASETKIDQEDPLNLINVKRISNYKERDARPNHERTRIDSRAERDKLYERRRRYTERDREEREDDRRYRSFRDDRRHGSYNDDRHRKSEDRDEGRRRSSGDDRRYEERDNRRSRISAHDREYERRENERYKARDHARKYEPRDNGSKHPSYYEGKYEQSDDTDRKYKN